MPGSRSARRSPARSSASSRVAYGWRVAFVVIAAFGLSGPSAWVLLATDKPEQHPRLGAAERAEIAEPTRPSRRRRRPPTLRDAAGPAGVLATAFAFFGYAYILYFFLSWFPSYLTMAQHLSIQHMGVVNVIPWLVGFIGLAAGGFVCDAFSA